MTCVSDLTPDQREAYDHQVQTAYDFYNARYDNQTYTAIQFAVMRDVTGILKIDDLQWFDHMLAAPPAHDILNLVTDVALELSGHPDMASRRTRLLRLIVEEHLTETSIGLIRLHLEKFEQAGSTFSADFANSAIAAVNVHELLEKVNSLVPLSSDTHGTAGNVVYHFARSVYGLLRAAELILRSEPDGAHIGEKLNAADRHLADAKQILSQCIPSFETPIRPYHTLVLSSDGTYPGMVTKVDEHLIQIRWYKWGFNSETFVGLLSPRQFEQQRLSAADCQKRFGGLPPEHH